MNECLPVRVMKQEVVLTITSTILNSQQHEFHVQKERGFGL